MLFRGTQFILPEIVDYEVRRELLRLKKTTAIQRLDDLASAKRPTDSASQIKMWSRSDMNYRSRLGSPLRRAFSLAAVLVSAHVAAQVQSAKPVFVDGQAQVVPAFSEPREWIHERLWVE